MTLVVCWLLLDEVKADGSGDQQSVVSLSLFSDIFNLLELTI